MFKFVAVLVMALVALAAAKPGIIGAPLAYSAPFVSAPAVYTREYHGNFAAPYVAAPYAASPYAAAYSAYSPYVAAPAYTAAYASPYLFK